MVKAWQCANGLFRLQSVFANNGLINDSVVQLSRTTDLWSAAPLQPWKRICGSLRTGLLHLTVAMANKIKLCVVSNSRRKPSFCRNWIPVFQHSTVCLLYSPVYPFSFQWDEWTSNHGHFSFQFDLNTSCEWTLSLTQRDELETDVQNREVI